MDYETFFLKTKYLKLSQIIKMDNINVEIKFDVILTNFDLFNYVEIR